MPITTATSPTCDKLLERLTATDVPGVTVALVEGDRIEWIRSAGVQRAGAPEPVTPSTRMLWFSLTKIVTATAAVQLADRGALDLDEPAALYLDTLAPRKGRDAVTIRHLLSHTAGVANPLPIRWVHPAGSPATESSRFARELLARHRKVARQPGARTRYSNLGYLALGEIISQASGRPFETYVQEAVLTPLGMDDTSFRYGLAIGGDDAIGHHPRRHPMSPLLRLLLPHGIVGPNAGRWMTFNPFEVDGAAYGGLIGPATDAARFLAMHAGDGTFEGARILSPASARAMRDLAATGRRLDVGLGWFRRRSDRATSADYVEHLGGGAGFWNMMRLYPSEGRGVLAMGNATLYDHQLIAEALEPKS
jgi:CubicO group peptidase (beta-lactamase class C family)